MACPNHFNEIQSTVELREDAYVNLRAPAVRIIGHAKTFSCQPGGKADMRALKITICDTPARRMAIFSRRLICSSRPMTNSSALFSFSIPRWIFDCVARRKLAVIEVNVAPGLRAWLVSSMADICKTCSNFTRSFSARILLCSFCSRLYCAFAQCSSIKTLCSEYFSFARRIFCASCSESGPCVETRCFIPSESLKNVLCACMRVCVRARVSVCERECVC